MLGMRDGQMVCDASKLAVMNRLNYFHAIRNSHAGTKHYRVISSLVYQLSCHD